MTTESGHKQEIESVFKNLKTASAAQGQTTLAYRKTKLKQLKRELLAMTPEWQQALTTDFAKSHQETQLSELLTVKTEISHVVRNLHDWMSPHAVGTPLTLMGTYSMVVKESKGVVLVIAPWNFPVLLTLGPLVTAFAAGNCCVVKPSEHTPATNAVLRKIISSVFKVEEVTVIEGEADITGQLLQLPFDHIFFTGSTRVGRIVMEAAAKNLTPVTLELGGKSPVIVDAEAAVNDAAMRIVWGKWFNAGQTCVAPDYVLADEKIRLLLIEKMRYWITRFYGPEPMENPDYTGIIHPAAAARLGAMAGVRVEGRRIRPTLLVLNSADQIPEEEIFGPVLPVVGFSDLTEALAIINARPKPLALYVFSHSRKNVDRVVRGTKAGTMAVNEVLLQFFNSRLPFGGIGASGIGKAHGHNGFLEFSNQKSVLVQATKFNAVWLVLPPFTAFKKRLINWIVRWL